MSFLAIAVDGQGVTMVADSLAYTRSARHVTTADKVHELPAVNALTASIGMGPFQRRWFARADELADQANDFDGFVRVAGDAIRQAWAPDADAYTMAGLDGRAVSVFLAGYSNKARKWKSYAYHSANGLAREDVDGMFLHPTPMAWRPSEFENTQLRAAVLDAFEEETAESVNDWMAPWEAQPPPPVPNDVARWVELAKTVRRSRIDEVSFAAFGISCLVGGAVNYLRLTETGTDRQTIHTFDDTGPEFVEMVKRSLHPLSQMSPCFCGSGTIYLDCCLAGLAAEACWCGTGKPMGDCCSLTAFSAMVRETV
jgi:hypothetical protein